MLLKHGKIKNISGLLMAVMFLFLPAKLNAEPSVDSYIRYMPSRGVEAMPGKVEITEADSEYSYEFKLMGKLPVKFSLDNNYIGIKETVDVELPAHLIGLTTDIETTLPFFNFNKTYLRIGISPAFYADDWDFPASSFRLLSRFIFLYVPNPKWTFVAGVAVYPDFEQEALPILGFIYKPTDKLTFNIVPKRPNITYLLNDKVLLLAEGGGSLNSEFETTRNDSKNVVLHYKEMHLGAGVRLKINKLIQSSLTAGAVFNRSLKYRDTQGKVNIKEGLYTELRTEIKF